MKQWSCHVRWYLSIDELPGNLNRTFHRLRQSGIDEALFDVAGGYGVLTKGA